MRQRFQLDHLRVRIYLGVSLAVPIVCAGAACYPAPSRVVPANLAPVTEAQVAGWVAATLPGESRLHRFKWLFQDDRGSLGGKGAARIAPPDSLRFDAEAVYGSETRSAAVIGTTPRWVEPPDALDRLVPDYTLMWALFGIARGAETGAVLRGIAEGDMVAWQYTRQADTVEYRLTRETPSHLVAEVRRGGKVVGRVQTTFDAGGALRTAELTVPSVPAKLNLTFLSTTRATFEPDVWRRRTP